MQPNWDDIKTVLHLVRGGSLASAASALEINYTTVARRIARIERHLGQSLFLKGAGGYLPTEAARQIAKSAEAMEVHTNQMLRAVSAGDQALSGTLVITAPQLLVASHLAQVFQKFRNTHPAVELVIRATNEILDLNRPNADLAIRISNSPDEALVGQVLAKQSSMAYGTPALAKKIAEDPMGPIEWVGMPHWKSPPVASLQKHPNGVIAYRFDDMTAVVGAAIAGLGIARLPKFLGDNAPGLIRLDVMKPQDYWKIWVLTHSDLRNTPKVSAFKDILIPFFKSRAADFYAG